MKVLIYSPSLGFSGRVQLQQNVSTFIIVLYSLSDPGAYWLIFNNQLCSVKHSPLGLSHRSICRRCAHEISAKGKARSDASGLKPQSNAL